MVFLSLRTRTTMRRQQTPQEDTMAVTALAQDDSPFFSMLPPEIREMIYQDIWSSSGPRQHIYKDDEQWAHVPCIADYSTGDNRFEKFTQSARGSEEEYHWVKRLKSEWCYHWCCEQSTSKWQRTQDDHHQLWRDENVKQAGPSGLMSLLLVCKRMYREALPSLCANTTFIFTDLFEAHEWLSMYGGSPEKLPIRSLEICILTTQLMTELYFPTSEEGEGPNPTFGHSNGSHSNGSHPGISMRSNPWQRVCDELALLPNLQSLYIWFHSRDLREWHKRMSETRFFSKLFDVHVKDRNKFVLALPDLPLKPKRGLPSHHFFENETLEGAPFVVERGPRPNNWRVHLMASGLRGP